MKLTCLGAGQEVGRSGILLKAKDKILLDYGLKLSPKSYGNSESEYPDDIERPLVVDDYLDAIVLSHAHLDHSGDIPSLYKKGSIPLFLTEATLLLSNLLWKDTMKIAKFNRSKCDFDAEDIRNANNSSFYLGYKTSIEITKNSRLTFYDAGHIVGSAISLIETEGQKVMYTGDFRGSSCQMFKGYDKKLPEVDCLITETTYGYENHKDRKKQEKEFIEVVNETLENGGIAMVPAFAIERCQEIATLLRNYKVKAPVYMDGMGVKAAHVFLDFPESFGDYSNFRRAMESTEFVNNEKKRRKALKGPAVIVSTAGMLEGGPMMYYIKNLGDDPKNKIILSGYQVDGTNGKRLLDTGKIYIDKKIYQPKAEIKKFTFSAHAGKNEILELIKKTNPKKIVCVHGDENNIIKFRDVLKNEGFKTDAPKNGETINLD